MDEQRQDDQLELIYNKTVLMHDIALKPTDDREAWWEKVQETNKRNLTRENLEPCERNRIFSDSSTKQRYKDKLCQSKNRLDKTI